jgi:hypothetical protein
MFGCQSGWACRRGLARRYLARPAAQVSRQPLARFGGNNEKCCFTVSCCDYSFPCFEWLWAKSPAHGNSCTAHADTGAADGNSSTANANNGTTYTDTTTVNTNGSTPGEDPPSLQQRR